MDEEREWETDIPPGNTPFLSIYYLVHTHNFLRANHCPGGGSWHGGLFAGQVNTMSQHRSLLVPMTVLVGHVSCWGNSTELSRSGAQLSFILCLRCSPGPCHYLAGGEPHRNGHRTLSQTAALHTSTRILATSTQAHLTRTDLKLGDGGALL